MYIYRTPALERAQEKMPLMVWWHKGGAERKPKKKKKDIKH